MLIDIVEDDAPMAETLREYIEGDGFSVRRIYRSGEDALAGIGTEPLPDVLLADVGLPGMSGIELTGKLTKKFPCLEIVIQTVFEDPSIIVDAIKAGASGYVLKACARDELRLALTESSRGCSFLSGKIARKVLKEFKERDASPGRLTALDQTTLSVREKEVMTRLAAGDSYKEIALALDISIHTVGNHIRKIYEKLQVNSRGEAVAKIAG